MDKVLQKFSNAVTKTNGIIAKYFAMWLIMPLIFAITYEVIARYLFNSPTIWAFDASWMLFGAYIVLGFGFVLAEDGHVRADVFYNIFPPLVKKIVTVVCYIVLFFPVTISLAVASFNMMLRSFLIQEASRSTIWAPLMWPIKFALFIGAVLLLAQGIVIFIKAVRELSMDIKIRRKGDDA